MLALALACLLGAKAFGPPVVRSRRTVTMSAGSPTAVGALLGQDGPLVLRKAGIDEPAQLTASAALLGVATACMGTAYARLLKAAVTLTWKTAPALLPPCVEPTLFMPAVCTLGGALVGLLAVNLPSTTMPDFIGTQNGQLSLPGLRRLAPVLLLSLLTSAFGFSVGPEAPMVIAGALVGSAFSHRLFGPENHAAARTMAYAGAAGALTTFIGMPVAGALFVLEITSSSAGISAAAPAALAPAAAASCASFLAAKALFAPTAAVGGHFVYPSVAAALSGRAMAAIALAGGVGGALVGRLFLALVQTYKRPMWPAVTVDVESCEADRRWACGPKARHVMVKATVGLAVGMLSIFFPQTLFWGEGSLQHVLDGQATPLTAVWPGLSPSLTRRALVDPALPFGTPLAALQVGAAKLVAIALACAGGFPGGIIFPLFFAAAALAHGLAAVVPATLMPVLVMSLMASTQASVTRTPLATVFMLGLSAAYSAHLSVLLPPVIVASYVGVWTAQLLSKETFFPYAPK